MDLTDKNLFKLVTEQKFDNGGEYKEFEINFNFDESFLNFQELSGIFKIWYLNIYRNIGTNDFVLCKNYGDKIRIDLEIFSKEAA